MIRCRLALRSTLLLACLQLLACGDAAEAPLRVGVISWPGYEPLLLAEADGALPHEQIQIVEQLAASDVMRLLRNGALDAAYLTLDETLTLVAEGLELEVILVADRSLGGDAVLVRPPRTSLADLKGSRIGVENTAVGAIMLAAALERAQLTPGDLELKFVPLNYQEQAYREGAIDALVTFDPVRSRLVAAGARKVFDSSQIPDRILDVLAVRRDIAPGREAALKTLVAGHFRGLHLLYTDSPNAMAFIARRWQLEPGQARTQFSGVQLLDLTENRRLLSGPSPPLDRQAAGLAELMRAANLLAAPPGYHRLARADYLPAD